MTELESLATLDHCISKFQADHCFVGRVKISPPPTRRIQLSPKKRIWSSIGISNFRPALMHEGGWIAQLIGQRCDGQVFKEDVRVPYHFDVDTVEASIKEAYGRLQAYRDCACGIIGHQLTDQKDTDGHAIFMPLYSTCEQHPAFPEPDTLS